MAATRVMQRPPHTSTPRQLMAMDAPEVLPAGSSRRDDPLKNHADPMMRGYFTVRETVVLREPLADGSHRA